MSNLGKRPMGTDSGSSSVASKQKGTPNKRWMKEMDDVLIPFLAEMARAGLKVDKSFKRQAFVEAATVINRSFTLPANMDADNVENHMRTIKQRYQELKKAHPKSKEWLNKPIKNHEELRLICGDDQATSQFSRSIYENFGVGNNEGVDEAEPDVEDMDVTPSEQGSQPLETPRVSVSTPTGSRGSRTSRATFDSTIEEIAKGVGELTCTLRESKVHWIENLSTVLLSMDDEYIEEELERAYDHLRCNKGDARGFVHRRPGMLKR
ncbi:hypothetical protein J5N97_030115 [Dioscorea zingiberensis]|uniref:Myb/SANT-like domain-containing protein n=1 Tax=Dioscorea zingiberensis TaxID=325984 RepID=A0A9D5BWI3_9LILI|nr:hypothetical protein J5N97_030115 [Dioscorea zingiberensis]